MRLALHSVMYSCVVRPLMHLPRPKTYAPGEQKKSGLATRRLTIFVSTKSVRPEVTWDLSDSDRGLRNVLMAR